MRKRHTMPHPAQPRHTNHWAPRTRKRHQQQRRPQRPTESSNPMQHAKGRTGDCPGPRKETATRRNVTQGVGKGLQGPPPSPNKFFGSVGLWALGDAPLSKGLRGPCNASAEQPGRDTPRTPGPTPWPIGWRHTPSQVPVPCPGHHHPICRAATVPLLYTLAPAARGVCSRLPGQSVWGCSAGGGGAWRRDVGQEWVRRAPTSLPGILRCAGGGKRGRWEGSGAEDPPTTGIMGLGPQPPPPSPTHTHLPLHRFSNRQ